jgi:hypothetical protein
MFMMGAILLGLSVAGPVIAVVAMVAVRRANTRRSPPPIDPAVVAAINAAVSALHPGARVTRIETEP